jgi:hypothetical protein
VLRASATASDGPRRQSRPRLGLYAHQRVRLIGPKAEERTGDDLLQIAVQDLLADTRRWDKTKVSLMGFLFGAMKSISSNWAKSYRPEETPVLEADLRKKNEEGKVTSPIDGYADERRTADEHMSHVETLLAIDNLFKEDQEAQMILTAWQDGYDPAGVRELWALSQNDYNTIVRRIRRTIDANNIRPDREGGAKHVQ